jgi:hypothetical protein
MPPPDKDDRRPRAESADQDGAGGNVETNLPPDAAAVPDELAEYVAQLRRRREASWRLPPLESGYRDPLDQLRRAAS